MNISLEKNGNVSAVLTVKMEKADYADNVKKAIKEMSRKAQMPGFRPGKVPVGLVQKMYGPQAKADAVNKLLNDSLFNYIKENKVNMLGEPLSSEKQQPQDIEKQEDFEFVFDIALAPEFKAELAKDDTVDYYDIEVSDEQVDAQVKQLAQQAGHPEEAESYEERDILRGLIAELDADGQPKDGGLQVEKVSLMPTYFKNDDQKKIFEGAKKNDVITFCPSKAYEGSETEVAALLKVEKEKVGEYAGNFSFQVEEISRFVPAELNQDFFDQVFGKDAVKNEEEFRNKVKEGIAMQRTADSDYKFLLDVRAYMENKVGQLEFPDELLKKIMKANNPDKDDNFVEENYVKSIEELKWHLIKEQLVAANDIKIEDKDVKAAAIQATRFQFAQYGMNNIPDEYLEQYASEMLKKKEQVNALVERSIDTKLTAVLKTVVTLNHKSISVEDFGKMFN
ncbi:trigger factor [Bacteroidaceae bacterium]|uniref:trigger factor n=1 Tax=Prevotella sp. MGM2 TaxID=2033406 RepID=UPI000CEA1898|nr:trigger factor [Prevotella sp. MGM2]GAY30189.1 trigger factor [Prevotella sp. MGM2]GFI33828.1 trigger factor [Bacteroidaceae bacterium]